MSIYSIVRLPRKRNETWTVTVERGIHGADTAELRLTELRKRFPHDPFRMERDPEGLTDAPFRRNLRTGSDEELAGVHRQHTAQYGIPIAAGVVLDA